MRRKILSVFLVFVMILSLTLQGGSIKASAANKNVDKTKNGNKIDIGPKLRKLDKDPKAKARYDQKVRESAEKLAASGIVAQSDTTASNPYIGTVKIYPAYDDINGVYLKQFTLKSVGQNCEVWVANNLSFGDSRPVPVVTQEQIDSVRDAFDNNIYTTDTSFFGIPDSHTGGNATLPGLVSKKLGITSDYYTPVDGTERVIILVDNIRDESYYDSTYPFFVAGLYWGTIEQYTDRNVITIDTNNWADRLQTTFLPTVAHEFQHLIHDDNDNGEETWINEGMADFAMYLCGYGHDWSSINYFLEHPENSLVNWDEYYSAETGPETIADYAQAYLFQLYLNDHFGKDFIQTLAKDTDHGINSVNKILKQFNTGIDFSELFKRYTIALTVDDTASNGGIYGFNSIDLKVNYDGALQNEKPGVPAWGADYIKLNSPSKIQGISFKGLEFMPTPWKVIDDPLRTGNKVLWGNNGDERDNQLIMPVDLTGQTEPSLSFDNYISIEEQWDFGFVQVSEDGGKTWKSLPNKNTRSDVTPDGYPSIISSMPGFTGNYRRWNTETFDLTPYAGKKILINFRYMTDWGSNGDGWYIDNISISGMNTNTCDTLDGFMSAEQVNGTRVDYAVSFISESGGIYSLKNFGPSDAAQLENIDLTRFFKGLNGYMVVWYAAPVGTKDPVDYNYTVKRR